MSVIEVSHVGCLQVELLRDTLPQGTVPVCGPREHAVLCSIDYNILMGKESERERGWGRGREREGGE